jgi:hypothetical protein
MTQALCIKCGAFKHGAFKKCDSCGFRPVEEHDLAYSLALTDCYFALQALRQIGAAMPEHGRPSLPPEQEEQMLVTIRSSASWGSAAQRRRQERRAAPSLRGCLVEDSRSEARVMDELDHLRPTVQAVARIALRLCVCAVAQGLVANSM